MEGGCDAGLAARKGTSLIGRSEQWSATPSPKSATSLPAPVSGLDLESPRRSPAGAAAPSYLLALRGAPGRGGGYLGCGGGSPSEAPLYKDKIDKPSLLARERGKEDVVCWTRPAAPSRPPFSRAPLFSGPVLGRESGNAPAVRMNSDFPTRRLGKTSESGHGAGGAGRRLRRRTGSSVDLHVCGWGVDVDSLHPFLHPKRTAPSRFSAGVERVSGSPKKRFL